MFRVFALQLADLLEPTSVFRCDFLGRTVRFLEERAADRPTCLARFLVDRPEICTVNAAVSVDISQGASQLHTAASNPFSALEYDGHRRRILALVSKVIHTVFIPV